MYFELKKGTTFIFIIALNYVENSKIFMLFPMCTHSHYITGFPIAKELALRGHEVTFVSCYPLKTPINNFRNIEVEGLRKSINSK